MITKEEWNGWIKRVMEYQNDHYPDVIVTENDILKTLIRSTIYMEQLIIDIGEDRKGK